MYFRRPILLAWNNNIVFQEATSTGLGSNNYVFQEDYPPGLGSNNNAFQEAYPPGLEYQ